MLLDLSPLRRHRDFRALFIGQWVSAFGSFLTYVALPVHIYELTKSSAVVGMLGATQLVPTKVYVVPLRTIPVKPTIPATSGTPRRTAPSFFDTGDSFAAA